MHARGVDEVARDTGEALDDEAALLLMARAVLEGPRDEGRASYQIALTVCEHCQRGKQDGAGEATPVGPEVIEVARCDAQRLGSLAVSGGEHVGASAARAAQDVAPAVRRLVLRRDHGRCVVPGCKHATWVDVHHLEAREEGGGHEPENLITVCGAHHRALHRGSLRAEGSPASGLTFMHADGSAYGRVQAPIVADVRAKTFLALRGLGFRESQAHWALARACSRTTALTVAAGGGGRRHAREGTSSGSQCGLFREAGQRGLAAAVQRRCARAPTFRESGLAAP